MTRRLRNYLWLLGTLTFMLLVVPALCYSQPWLVCDPAARCAPTVDTDDDGVLDGFEPGKNCWYEIEGFAWHPSNTKIPPQLDGSIRFDVGPTPVSSTQNILVSIVTLWDKYTAPFVYERPGPAEIPVGVRLQFEDGS